MGCSYGMMRTVHAAKTKHKRIRSTTSIPQNRLWIIDVSLDGMSALRRAYVFFGICEVVDDGGMWNGSGFNQDNDEAGCTVFVLLSVVITQYIQLSSFSDRMFKESPLKLLVHRI